MKLVLNQNQVGKFNMLGDEESLAFSLAFREDDGTPIYVGKDGLPLDEGDASDYRAIFTMPRNEDDPHGASQWYKEMFDNADYDGLLYEHQKHGGFTTGLDYPAQRVMFAYFIEHHYEEIYSKAVEQEKTEDQKTITQLKTQLEKLENKVYGVADAQDTPSLFNGIIAQIEKEIASYKKYRDEYKEGNENWSKWDERVNERMAYLERINSIRTLRRCDDCGELYKVADGRFYKYEAGVWLCDGCHDARMEEE